jgi:hypothetical protein
MPAPMSHAARIRLEELRDVQRRRELAEVVPDRSILARAADGLAESMMEDFERAYNPATVGKIAAVDKLHDAVGAR